MQQPCRQVAAAGQAGPGTQLSAFACRHDAAQLQGRGGSEESLEASPTSTRLSHDRPFGRAPTCRILAGPSPVASPYTTEPMKESPAPVVSTTAPSGSAAAAARSTLAHTNGRRSSRCCTAAPPYRAALPGSAFIAAARAPAACACACDSAALWPSDSSSGKTLSEETTGPALRHKV